MSIIKSAIIVLGVSVVIALGARTSKAIMNVSNTPVSPGKSLQVNQLRSDIFTAVVEIPQTTSNYSIVFKSGVNLSEKDGQIHKNYNGWVQNLDNRIKAELTRL